MSLTRSLLLSPVLALSLFLLTACGSPFSDAPPVADSTFASALAELHLAEARLRLQQTPETRRLGRRDTMRVPVPPPVRDSILARHGLSEGQFRSALAYYVEHPERYKEVYVRVVDTLNAEREAFRFEDERSGAPPSERPTPRAFQKK